MTDLLKQAIDICKQLSYEDNDALRTVLHGINYKRKELIEQEIKQAMNE